MRKRVTHKPARRRGCMAVLLMMGTPLLLCLAGVVAVQIILIRHRIDISRHQKAYDELQSLWVPLPTTEGLQEYRGAIHVHSALSHDSLGTLDQILDAAKSVGVQFVIMADHLDGTPAETCAKTIQGVYDGIVFIPGIEMTTPQGGILAFGWTGSEISMSDPVEVTSSKIRAAGGLTFICHSEGWPDWNFPVDGVELFNLHADVMDEDFKKLLFRILYSVKRYPFACFQEVYAYPADRFAKWDAILAQRPLSVLAGNDAHRNVGIQCLFDEKGALIVRTADGTELKKMSAGPLKGLAHAVWDETPNAVAREFILDEYANSFSYVSTRILAPSLTRENIMEALALGRSYICYEAVCNPTGFRFAGHSQGRIYVMGERCSLVQGTELHVSTPIICSIRLIRDGQTVVSVSANSLIHYVEAPGAYRVECWVHVSGEERLWIASNPIIIQP